MIDANAPSPSLTLQNVSIFLVYLRESLSSHKFRSRKPPPLFRGKNIIGTDIINSFRRCSLFRRRRERRRAIDDEYRKITSRRLRSDRLHLHRCRVELVANRESVFAGTNGKEREKEI